MIEPGGDVRARPSAILISPSGINLRYAARLQFTKETYKCTNNIVEYKLYSWGSRSYEQWEFKFA
jgi:hypothetical protein